MPEHEQGERGGFDAPAFFSALDAERQARRITWKQVASEAGISQSTLTRLAQGRRPDVDSLAVLVDWAGLKADDFVVRVHSAQEAAPLAMISTYLKSDRNLTPEAASALEKVVKATYEALRQS
jgi:transcriptional regulator with XRE-family HTH domain